MPQRFTLSLPFPPPPLHPPPSCCFEIKAFPKIGASESIPAIAGLGGKRAISQVKLCLQSPKLCLTFLIPQKKRKRKKKRLRLDWRVDRLDSRLVPSRSLPRYCLLLMRQRGCSPANFELKAAECTSSSVPGFKWLFNRD